jgi:menaquinone-dependent protoporphyrinogen IX oxidase
MSRNCNKLELGFFCFFFKNLGVKLKCLIIYKTLYGSTKEYAEWISEELKADIIDINKAGKIDFNNYDTIIFGCYIFFSKVPIRKFIINNWTKFENKNIILYTTSGINPEKGLGILNYIVKSGFPRDIRKKIKFFHFSGRYLINKFNIIHRALIRFGSLIVKDPQIKNGMKVSNDGVKRDKINDLVRYLQELKG